MSGRSLRTFTLVPHRHDAEDILQETCLTIYDKFQEFTPAPISSPGPCAIAWWKVRQARQKFARSKVVFNDEVLEAVAHTAENMQEETRPCRSRLANCLQKLNERDPADDSDPV